MTISPALGDFNNGRNGFQGASTLMSDASAADAGGWKEASEQLRELAQGQRRLEEQLSALRMEMRQCGRVGGQSSHLVSRVSRRKLSKQSTPEKMPQKAPVEQQIVTPDVGKEDEFDADQVMSNEKTDSGDKRDDSSHNKSSFWHSATRAGSFGSIESSGRMQDGSVGGGGNRVATLRPKRNQTDAEQMAEAKLKVANSSLDVGQTSHNRFTFLEGTSNWCIRRRARMIVHSRRFEPLMGLLIIINTITLGVEIQVALENGGESSGSLVALEHVFLCCFVVELILRLLSEGWHRCFRNSWFLLDLVLVTIGVLAAWIMRPVLEGSQLTAADDIEVVQQVLIVRILRLVRLVRALRLIEHFKELWKLTNGLIKSSRTVLSALSLVLVTIYGFACLGIETIYKAKDLQENPVTGPIVREHFSSLPRTMLTLVAFTNADSIAEIYVPIIEAQPLLAVYFCGLWLVVTVSLMNLVTAVIVENAISNAGEDAEMTLNERRKQLKRLIPSIKDVFQALDVDGTGLLTLEELNFSKVKMPQELRDIIQPDKLHDLFEFLDMDESGEIDSKEFVDGVCHLALSSVPVETTQILQLLRSQKDEISIIKEHIGCGTAELNQAYDGSGRDARMVFGGKRGLLQDESRGVPNANVAAESKDTAACSQAYDDSGRDARMVFGGKRGLLQDESRGGPHANVAAESKDTAACSQEPSHLTI